MSDEEVTGWGRCLRRANARELDGSEPVDDPPAGFASWDEWRGDRRPPWVS